MIKVLIVDDQALIREGLNMMLSLYEDIHIIGEAINGQEAIKLLQEKETDVILMDIRMPIMDGVEATRIIKEKYPHIKIIILTTFNEDEYIFQGLNYGADGYILKDVSSKELINSIKSVYRGDMLFHGEVAKTIAGAIKGSKTIKKESILESLTPRELEIAKLVGEGKSNKEISEMLYITEGTVKNHITRILDKLELRDRTQLVIYLKNRNKIF
ncbi:response regulator transcription factor [Tepidimicrobium xylanilyticum]|uniref:Two component transcriptional regulator, LuxR family n=1 Tax=Tepidimicrobium xylanilyticum TaxID=1123352 RepID=A0A1H2Z9M7_9FIRM|nr:response regulator transcription factor [Tepidimicrobium xylanilyticum]GMG96423.1 DNA-binding response regulator [Tepidimicrobium xylanilyticum]SDX14036.1 two component transcriptional regulator, LuxR family [Tepidimicrobium xylanilyticum]